jgi:hypothetical protein
MAADEIERLREARHQALEAGDAARREVNRLHARLAEIEAWQQKGVELCNKYTIGFADFRIGKWWGERPWR